MAEGRGFEPLEGFLAPQLFSKQSASASRPTFYIKFLENSEGFEPSEDFSIASLLCASNAIIQTLPTILLEEGTGFEPVEGC